MTDFSDKEVQVILSALAQRRKLYRSLLENSDGITGEAAKEALQTIESAEKKLNLKVPKLEASNSSQSDDTSDPQGASQSGEFLYLYLPDGIRDQKLEEELASRIPDTEDPEPDNFFWSNKFNNFVVKAEFEAEVKEAIRARYNGDAILKENPGWAKKPNTFQVIRKEDIQKSRKRQKGG